MTPSSTQFSTNTRSWRLGAGRAALLTALVTLTVAPELRATNDEANGRVSWFNGNSNSNHTVIFVHGRMDKNHSPQRYILENTSLVHYCRHPALTPWQQYRCAMRQDVNSYWSTVGVWENPGDIYSAFNFEDIRNNAAYYDYRTLAGPCNLSFGSTTCTRRQLNDNERVVVTSSRDWLNTGRAPGSNGYVRRQFDGALVPGEFQNTHVRYATFVGYYGDSDPTVGTHIGLDGQPNPYLIANAGPTAIAALDRAMWEYCSNGRAAWFGEAPWRTCSIVCHSAGCHAVGMYLANGWGPGSPYHSDRNPDDPLFAKSGLSEVFSLNSAAGGSRLADINDGRIGGAFEPQTPMTNSLRRSVAMNRYVHGQQQGDYTWVPTYYLGADNRLHDYKGHNMNRFFSDDFFFQEWDNTTPNDGAVTGRSQCGGTGTKDVAEDGEGNGPTQGRSCAWFAAEPGRQYGSHWYNLMELCRSNSYSCRYLASPELGPVTWQFACAYDDRKQMCNKDHSTLSRHGVQVLTDLWGSSDPG
jgi:hypothetical protein